MSPLRDAAYVAAFLDLSEEQVHRLARSGDIECVQIGRRRMWTDDQLAAIVARHSQPARIRTASSPVVVTPMRTRQARGPQRRTA